MKLRILQSLLCGLCFAMSANGSPVESWAERFQAPPADCRPHTRWWWMGNALRKEDITFDLEQMHDQGIGGVEQITMEEVYNKGNHDYLSPEYFELLRHAVAESKRLGLEFSLNFGGPGWIFGGKWVPKADQSKVMIASAMDVHGPLTVNAPLSKEAVLNPRDIPRSTRVIGPEDQLVAVVTGRLAQGRLESSTLTVLTAKVVDGRLSWEAPAGDWRIMAFWLTQRENLDAVDHLNEDAMSRYCETLGQQLKDAVGAEFGHTIESVFSDSFEVPIFRNGMYWSDGLFEAFARSRKYDLVPYLPALWYDIDLLSPKVRYDVNEFLHETGMRTFFGPFLRWCESNNLHGRIQAYGFVTDNIEGAGAAHIPEMEVTAGEKDAVPWFDTRVSPREYTASGAHLYGRNIVSTEAYTFMHWQPYRASLEELKIASDIFLLSGANKFYNHGFSASPERDLAPSRRFFVGEGMSPENVWWRHYHHLADYLGRSCYLLRQGNPVVDVAVYSPLANQWTQDVLNARKWTRNFEWGDLGGLLRSNGYNYDLINDDILQHHSETQEEVLVAGSMRYRALIIPNTEALPLETMQRIEGYVRGGGTVIAVDRMPTLSTGLEENEHKDKEVRRISERLFPKKDPVAGGDSRKEKRAHFVKLVIGRTDQLDQVSAPMDPLIKILHNHLTPDLGLDLISAGERHNENLLFFHRQAENADLYFVSNVRDRAIDTVASFRVTDRIPSVWDPTTGTITPIPEYDSANGTTRIPVRLAPYASAFYVFSQKGPEPHTAPADGIQVERVDTTHITGLVKENGIHTAQWIDGSTSRECSVDVRGIPSPYVIKGAWKMLLVSPEFSKYEATLDALTSWTENPATCHFSGTGQYVIAFTMPTEYLEKDLATELDLGAVGNVAEVQLNGKNLGVTWVSGQTLAIPANLLAATNTLVVSVTNTSINRITGWKDLPEVPEALQAEFGTDPDRRSGEAAPMLAFEPLPRSGLLGPVRVLAGKRVEIAVPEK